ncbi:MAG: nucleoside hydrolase [Phycisphaerales bacterium]
MKMRFPKKIGFMACLMLLCIFSMASAKIPVILDTDIGDDIDDTWSLLTLLQSPEFDLKLVVTATGDTALRAKIVAKILEQTGRTDIPIAVGKKTPDKFPTPFGKFSSHPYFQRSWIEDYDIKKYKGKIIEDGVDAMIQTIMHSKQQVVIIAIGPLPNLAEALKREPLIAEKSKIVGMLGSVYKGYSNSQKIAAEWNIATYIKDAQQVFAFAWPMTITPLDTCGVVKLQGENYQKILHSNHPAAKTVIDSYRCWLNRPGEKPDERYSIDKGSTVLYDTVAIYLALSEDLFKMEQIGLTVDGNGFTVIDPNAKKVKCAVEWKNIRMFEDFLVSRLTGEILPKRPPALSKKLRDQTLIPPHINFKPGEKYLDENRGFGMILGMERTPEGRLWISWIAGGDSEVGYALLAYSE